MEFPKERRPTNHHVVVALTKLKEMLTNDEQVSRNPPHLSHYRQIPDDVSKAYELLTEGSQLVHGTATKYTLIGKIDEEEQKKLGADLLGGCEILGAAAYSLIQDATGCSYAVRRSVQRAALGVIVNVIHLAEAFDDHTALDKNIGAQKTGAVWDACDKILNRTVPQGNRNAIRRELFTWTRETNDTMEEFQEMVDQGPIEMDDPNEMDDLFGTDDQYSDSDLPVAKACMGLLKCSRGTLKLSLEGCEALGDKYTETSDVKFLDWIMQIHGFARSVGEGITDMGSVMYPPIIDTADQLKEQVQIQVEAIVKLHETVLEMEGLPPNVLELATVLRAAIETRQAEFQSAIETLEQ
eukprot:Nitzschia sp. Nitz4//scaffold5_size260463//125686//126744//NITZ4_000983-RA/size260463-processed-gene-0.75-mRNA-1//1//CDS//3329555343//4677//frame0